MSDVNRDLETWLPVPGYEGYYEVSDQGRVRSLNRTIEHLDRWGNMVSQRIAGRMMRLKVGDPYGHLHVRLNKEGHGRGFQVHRLVLEAFVGPCPDDMECCHNNGVSSDNLLGNLRWDTAKSNAADRIKHGVHAGINKTHCPRNHRLAEPNLNPAALRGKRPQRACLACARADARLKKRRKLGETVPMAAWADWYYTQIMGAPAPPPPEPLPARGPRPETVKRKRRLSNGQFAPADAGIQLG